MIETCDVCWLRQSQHPRGEWCDAHQPWTLDEIYAGKRFMTRRIALLLPWMELAATFLPHDPAAAERMMRRALVVTR